MFHQVIRHGVCAFVPTADDSEVAHIARWFSHFGLRAAAELTVIAGQTKEARRVDRSAVQLLRRHQPALQFPELQQVARAFIDLQDARHDADYADDYSPVRFDTLEHVRLADQSVRLTWLLWKTATSSQPQRQDLHDRYRRFLLLALLKSGGPRTR